MPSIAGGESWMALLRSDGTGRCSVRHIWQCVQHLYHTLSGQRQRPASCYADSFQSCSVGKAFGRVCHGTFVRDACDASGEHRLLFVCAGKHYRSTVYRIDSFGAILICACPFLCVGMDHRMVCKQTEEYKNCDNCIVPGFSCLLLRSFQPVNDHSAKLSYEPCGDWRNDKRRSVSFLPYGTGGRRQCAFYADFHSHYAGDFRCGLRRTVP